MLCYKFHFIVPNVVILGLIRGDYSCFNFMMNCSFLSFCPVQCVVLISDFLKLIVLDRTIFEDSA